MTYREKMEKYYPKNLQELEQKAKEVGERQTFRTGEYIEQCDGFMEPKDYFELVIYVYPDGKVTGRLIQIY